MLNCVYLGLSGYTFQIILYFLHEALFTITLWNSADPDKIEHDAAFNLGLHCL